MKLWISSIAVLTLLTGCISNESRSYTDNKYQGYQITSLAVVINAPQAGVANAAEQAIEEKFKEYNVRTVDLTRILPPTRQYSDEEISEALATQDIEMMLVANIVPSQEQSETFGYNSYSSGSAYTSGNMNYGYGYGSYSGTTHGSGTTNTYAMKAFKRNTLSNGKIINAKTGEIVWTSEMEIQAKGKLFTSDSAIGGHVAETIVANLDKDGHISKPKK